MDGVDNQEGRSLLWRDSGEQEMGDHSGALHVQVMKSRIAIWNSFTLDSALSRKNFFFYFSPLSKYSRLRLLI
jgi:hypothetical protein